MSKCIDCEPRLPHPKCDDCGEEMIAPHREGDGMSTLGVILLVVIAGTAPPFALWLYFGGVL